MAKIEFKELKTLKDFEEKIVISKVTGIEYNYNNAYGKCEVISKEELIEQLEGNECFYKCENIPLSKYKFYIDEEIVEYYAVLKK